MSDAPVLDLEAIERIRALEAVRPGLLAKLIGMFLNTTSENLQQAAQLLDSEPLDHEALRVLFHTLKGSAANLGALALSATASQAESQAKQGDSAQSLAPALASLQAEFQRTRAAMQDLVADRA